ncbi:hypothetical protein [Iningainema tapete]|uniref:Uncharacterized protein n=1 Tax=Iningainema tapete BLCC-T55 TaxID=2748662 RepID=A0A8J7C3Y7_9CYAN|nr:hypothetical protein [Iningainema tapete]MBD2770669.1 hypothetical protein [Iningainema tapete BLCC-T55]
MDLLEILNHHPGWDYRLSHEGVNIYAPSKSAAAILADLYEHDFLETAFKLKGKVKIGWRRCRQPIEFHGWMAMHEPAPHETAQAILSNDGRVFSSIKDLPLPLLKRMVTAGESDLPWSIIRNSDQKIVILNTPMSNLIATPKELATERVCSDYWRIGNWEELQDRYRLYGHFTWHYDAGLNDYTWADLETDFERFEVDGAIYGQNIIYRVEVVPMPEDVMLPV